MGQLIHMTNNKQPITGLLHRTVARALKSGKTTYYALEQETGVVRASIRRFVRGERTLRLDMADKLAAHFGLELRLKKKG